MTNKREDTQLVLTRNVTKGTSLIQKTSFQCENYFEPFDFHQYLNLLLKTTI